MKLREVRKELGLSQAQFAKLLGVHQTAVSQWETGRTAPETQMLMRISRLSGRPVDELMNDAKADAELPEINAPFEMRMPDSGMRGARIEEGDTVYLRADGSEMNSGAIIAVETDKGVLIRYLYRVRGEALLVSASPEYPPAPLPKGAKILGRAYAFRSPL